MPDNSNDRTVAIYPPPRGTYGLPFVAVSIFEGRRYAEFGDSLEDAIALEPKSREAISRDTQKVAG